MDIYGIVWLMKPKEVKLLLLKKFIPHLRVDSIYDIDLQALKAEGIRGIITDLDNTLVGAKDPNATPELTAWLTQVRELGFKVVIVSNNNRVRVSAFAEPIELPFVSHAKKPGTKAFHRALALLGMNAEQAVVIGDQLMTDVFGGNRMKLRTILVTPIAPNDESVFTGFNRRLERFIYKRLRKRGWIAWDK
jgi:HAD superfamily phosphatase (TIGR01668 family)